MTAHECDFRYCDKHPHCGFCGGVMDDKGSYVVCVNCGREDPIVNLKPAELERVLS